MPTGYNSNNTDYHSNDEEDDNFKIKARTQQQKKQNKNNQKMEIRTLSQSFAIEFWDSSTKLQSLSSKMPRGISDF